MATTAATSAGSGSAWSSRFNQTGRLSPGQMEARSYHEFLTLARDEALWGDPASIWPGERRPVWLNLEDQALPDPADVAAVVSKLSTYPEAKGGGTKRRDDLVGHFADIAQVSRIAELAPAKIQHIVASCVAPFEKDAEESGGLLVV